GRGELAESFDQFRGHVQQQMNAMGAQQRERIESFDKRLGESIERTNRSMEALSRKLAEDARKAGSDHRESLER
ncbi:hypothetical protein, partial [Acinetobacter baumannii]|uniref:hypothetical protein n=1 Tax=Acinetobacter baumannii TaxID=470 RepID=UPI001C0861B2